MLARFSKRDLLIAGLFAVVGGCNTAERSASQADGLPPSPAHARAFDAPAGNGSSSARPALPGLKEPKPVPPVADEGWGSSIRGAGATEEADEGRFARVRSLFARREPQAAAPSLPPSPEPPRQDATALVVIEPGLPSPSLPVAGEATWSSVLPNQGELTFAGQERESVSGSLAFEPSAPVDLHLPEMVEFAPELSLEVEDVLPPDDPWDVGPLPDEHLDVLPPDADASAEPAPLPLAILPPNRLPVIVPAFPPSTGPTGTLEMWPVRRIDPPATFEKRLEPQAQASPRLLVPQPAPPVDEFLPFPDGEPDLR